MSAPDPHPTSTGETESHYEKPQLRAKAFVIGIGSFFSFVALLYLVVWHLAGTWTHGGQPFHAPPAPASADARWTTQAPQLQINPGTDLQKLRQIEYQRLHTVRWTDDAYAAIPIEDAMRLMAIAAAKGQISTLLPAPQPATPLELQNQKSREAAPKAPTP
jgi:hypothetical protein